MSPSTAFEVVAYSGYRGEQEPRELVVEAERIAVVVITDRWIEPDARHFKLQAADGCIYHVRCDHQASAWSLVRRWRLDS